MSLLSFTQYDICQDALILPLLSQKLQFPYGETLPKECTEKLCSLIESAALLYDSPSPTTPLSIKILLLQILETLFLHNAFLTVSEETLFKRTSNFDPLKEVFTYIETNQRDIFQHVPITSRKPVKPDSKGVPGFFAFWGSSRILANPGAS